MDIKQYPKTNICNDLKEGEGRVIGWWSGGVASAIACKLAIERYCGKIELAFCDTGIEHPDTYRFMYEFEKVMGIPINRLTSTVASTPEQVWRKYKGLNFAHGAPCSTVLKREVRIKHQETLTDFGQVFGFDYCKKEMRRATNMLNNYPEINPIFPLIVEQYDREKIFKELDRMGIKPPITYQHFLNNNCIGAFDSPIGGCVQGGIGYWQKIRDLFPKKFEYMSNIEHELSRQKGYPVTICKDQRKGTKGNKLFLKPNPEFPEVESIDVIKGRRPVTMFECNGFCSTIDQED